MNARHYVADYPHSDTFAAFGEAEEQTHGALSECRWCTRGHMHRAHRATLLDFIVSLVGLYPTICSYCNAPGHRLYPKRLVALLCVASLALAYFVVLGPKRVLTQSSEFEAPSPVVFLGPRAARVKTAAVTPTVDYSAQR
jgi:hypothetical protein